MWALAAETFEEGIEEDIEDIPLSSKKLKGKLKKEKDKDKKEKEKKPKNRK